MTTTDAPRGWRLGAPGGVPVYVSYTWPIFALIIVVYFGPQIARLSPGIGTGAYLVAAGYALLLLLSVLAHEAAHAAAARACGCRVGQIVMDLFGGHTTYEATGLTPGRSAAIAVAGPLANGALAVLGWVALPVLPEGVPWLLGLAFVITNALVGAFNLLPGHPLDGGHLLDAAVWKVTGRRHLGLLTSGWAGRLLVVALLVWIVVWPLVQGNRPSFLILAWAGLLGALLWSGASQAVRAGRELGSYERIALHDVLVPVVVVDHDAPMGEVAHAASERREHTGRTPVVLVRDPAGIGVLMRPPEGTDIADDTPVAALTARLGEGWLLDVHGTPELSEVVDRMHERSGPLVVLRRDGELLGAVTALAVNEALGRA